MEEVNKMNQTFGWKEDVWYMYFQYLVFIIHVLNETMYYYMQVWVQPTL